MEVTMLQNKRFKTLGGSLLAVVALTAVGASTAQADWTITNGESETLHLKVSGFFNLGVIRTTTQQIHCKSNFWGEALVQLSQDHKTSSTTASFIASCSVKGAEEFCTVSSPESESGDVLFEAEGVMTAKEGTIYATLEDEDIATLIISGVFCPLPEEETLSGSMTLTMPNAEEETTTHSVEVDEAELFLGKNKAFLDGEEEKEGGAFTGKVETEEKSPFSISFTE